MKKKNLKKVLSLLLAMAMAGSLLACGGKTEEVQEPSAETENTETPAEEAAYYNKTGFPICDETITITVGARQRSTPDWPNTKMVSAIERDMGIKMDITNYPDDTWATQLSLMLADDSFPDLVLAGKWEKATANQAGKDGYLLDMSQYLDVMPNLSKVLEENPDYAASIKAEGGAIYGLSNFRADEISCAMSQIRISKADMEKYGFTMEDFSTTEGFYNALKKVKTTDPDKIPLLLSFDQGSGQRTEWMIRSAFGVNSANNYYMLGTDENENVILQDTSDNYKAYLEYMNLLYEEKLINEDAYIITPDELSAKIANKEAVFVNSWLPFAQDIGATDDSWVADYEVIVGMKSDLIDETVYSYYPATALETVTYVSADTEYPEAICRMLDHQFSIEGARFFKYGGNEGENYDLVVDELGVESENTDNYFDSDKYSSVSQWIETELSASSAFGCYQSTPVAAYICAASDAELEKIVSEMKFLPYVELAQRELAIRNQCDKKLAGFPFLVYSEEEATERTGLYTDISVYLQQMKGKFITGELDINAEWDNYVAKAKEIGVDRILEIEQAAYTRYAANLK